MELRDKFGMNFLFTNEGHYCNAREHATKSTKVYSYNLHNSRINYHKENKFLW